ncbi:MAG: hypothetical protein LBJ64_01070 [Deltaproteobacteria bacterium]|jgi:hypothetical protein|nr:hypothetical protein [Deltaproteobacteria bacterium]
MSNSRSIKIFPVMLLLLLFLFGCGGGSGQLEETVVKVVLRQTTSSDLIRVLGPPVQRASWSIDRPLERLHFNIPYYRVLRIEITDPSGEQPEAVIRRRSQALFLFTDGYLTGVE